MINLLLEDGIVYPQDAHGQKIVLANDKMLCKELADQSRIQKCPFRIRAQAKAPARTPPK